MARLLVFGPSGLVGREIIRQCLANSQVKSILAISRRPLDVPEDAGDSSKLNNIILKDFTQYSDELKEQLADTDCCIWTLGITPTRSRLQPFEQVRETCQTYTLAALHAIADGRRAKNITSTFRFLYFSGHGVVREYAKKPLLMGDYLVMRGEVERAVIEFAKDNQSSGMEACVVRPGLITSDAVYLRSLFIQAGSYIGIHKISVEECAAASIQQVLDGFVGDPLTNTDLVRIGRKALEDAKRAPAPEG